MLKKLATFQSMVYQVLDPSQEGGRVSKGIGAGLVIIILGNVISIMLESYEHLAIRYETYFQAFEVFTIGVFTLTYILRLWSCTTDTNFSHPLWGRMTFLTRPLIILDLIVIAPFYLQGFFPTTDLRILLLARLSRLLLLFKLTRYTHAFVTLGRVFYSRRLELGVTLFVAGILLIIGATLMYILESTHQPEKFSNIPDAIWWTVITLTTVGYGDVYPITSAGKILAGFLALSGIGLIALPTAILGSAFLEELEKQRQAEVKFCPHCGMKLSE